MLTGAGRGVVVFRWLDAIEEAVAAASREAARAGKGHDRTLTSLDLRTAYRLKKWLDAEFRCFRSGSDIADDLAVSLTAAKGSLHRPSRGGPPGGHRSASKARCRAASAELRDPPEHRQR